MCDHRPAAQVPGKHGVSAGARHPNPAPLRPLPFQPGNHPSPTSHSPLRGKCRGGGGTPAPRPTGPPPWSPLAPPRVQYFIPGGHPGGGARGPARGWRSRRLPGGEDLPGARAPSGDGPAAKVQTPGTERRKPFFLALVSILCPPPPPSLPLLSPSICACGRCGPPSNRGETWRSTTIVNV